VREVNKDGEADPELEARRAELEARWTDWAETMFSIDRALAPLWADFRALQAASVTLRACKVDPGAQVAALVRKIALGDSLLKDGR
jgi:hypothetical protein